MNMIFPTNDRVFMALVGPWGSGETRVILSILASLTTIYPPIENTFYYFKKYQQLSQEMSERLNNEFIAWLDFEMIKKLDNCLLVFDSSCEENYQEQAFVKLAVAIGGKLHCIFVKHNLFHQQHKQKSTLYCYILVVFY